VAAASTGAVQQLAALFKWLRAQGATSHALAQMRAGDLIGVSMPSGAQPGILRRSGKAV